MEWIGSDVPVNIHRGKTGNSLQLFEKQNKKLRVARPAEQ